jgi:hypothetical protein
MKTANEKFTDALVIAFWLACCVGLWVIAL